MGHGAIRKDTYSRRSLNKDRSYYLFIYFIIYLFIISQIYYHFSTSRFPKLNQTISNSGHLFYLVPIHPTEIGPIFFISDKNMEYSEYIHLLLLDISKFSIENVLFLHPLRSPLTAHI